MPSENEARLIMQARDTAATLLETGTPPAELEAMATGHDANEARSLKWREKAEKCSDALSVFAHAHAIMTSRAMAAGIRQAIAEHEAK